MVQTRTVSNRSVSARKIRPQDIRVPEGYKVDVFATGLTTPINMTFGEDGEVLIADAGIISGNGKVLRLVRGKAVLVADGFNPPLTGITVHKGCIYVAHRGFVTVVRPDGGKHNVLSDLPSLGDHHNNRVVFGSDGKMYFGQGTATNSGVVGLDNSWRKNYPYFHDYPGSTIELKGINFRTKGNLTGAYSPYGVPTVPGEDIQGHCRASGSILRANPDGSKLELVAWGLRNPFRIRFDCHNNLLCANHGIDVRGSRPVDNSPDEFQWIRRGMWYGWPDFTGGYPVTKSRFKAPGHRQPEFLLASHPMIPPRPLVNFEPHAAIMGFDFNYNPSFGQVGDVYISEFGSEAPETTGGKPAPKVGHRVTRIDMQTYQLHEFAINKSGYPASYTGGGGLERPIDVVFGPSGDMFVVDFGSNAPGGDPDKYLPNTGVIWRISKC